MSQRSNIILLLVIPLFGILYFAYVWPSKKSAEQSDAPQVTVVSPRHSADRTRAKKAAELAGQPQPVEIDINARLLALYERYPELAVNQRPPAPETLSLIETHFSEHIIAESEQSIILALARLGLTFQPLPYNQEEIDKCREATSQQLAIMKLHGKSESFYSSMSDTQRQFCAQLALLDFSYATHTQNYDAAHRSLSDNALLFKITPLAIQELEQQIFSLATRNLEEARSLNRALPPNQIYLSAIVTEYSERLKQLYQHVHIDRNGEYVLTIPGIETDIHVELDYIESTTAAIMSRKLQAYANELDSPSDNSGANIGMDLILEIIAEDQKLKDLLTGAVQNQSYNSMLLQEATDSNDPFSDEYTEPHPLLEKRSTSSKSLSRLLIQVFVDDPQLTYSNNTFDEQREFYTKRQLNRTAIEIAHTHSQGEEYTSPLPINITTGKTMLWNKENGIIGYYTSDDIEIPSP